MKDCIKCGIACLAIGMVVGGIVVAKNKNLASKINEGTDKIQQKFDEVKDDVEQKIEDVKEKMAEEEVGEQVLESSSGSKKQNKKKN